MQEPVVLPDYELPELNRLALVLHAMERMEPEERHRIFKWLKSKYLKEWPSDSY